MSTDSLSLNQLVGLDYGPFRDNESPTGTFPTLAELKQDAGILAPLTPAIRLYSSANNFASIIPQAIADGLKVIPGAFLLGGSGATTNNNNEINSLIQAVNQNGSANFPFITVGSEAISGQGLSSSQVAAAIDQVRQGTGNSVRIATSETPSAWLANPSLAAAVDVILVDVYTFAAGNSPSQAAASAIAAVQQVQSAYSGKTVLIGETGWPSAQGSSENVGASIANEEAYAADILQQASAAGIGMFYFEAFDEAWKAQASGRVSEANFGLFTSMRNANSANAKGTVSSLYDVLSPWSIARTGDFTGDGKTDLAYQNAVSGVAEIQFINGTAATGGGMIANNPFDANWNVVGAGDFNGDGHADLVYQNRTNDTVEIQFLNGNAAVGGGMIANSPFGAGWMIAGTGDFNQDGKSDLVWQNKSTAQVEIQFLNGTTAIGGGTISNNAFGADWKIVGSGDFNGDGKTDLVWQNQFTDVAEIQFLNGNTATGGGVIANSPFGAGWDIMAVGDFNSDGKADLVWQNQSSGLVELQFLNGNAAIGGGAISNNPFGAGWFVTGSGDFNGDGKADLVYRNLTGTTNIQLLNGTTPLAAGTVPFG